MKVLFVQAEYFIDGLGGAEKICCFVANSFVEKGYDVEIATMEDIEGKPLFYLDSRVKLTNLFNPEIPQFSIKPVIRYEGKNPIKWIYGKYLREKAKFYNKKVYKKIGGAGEKYLFEYNLRNRSKVWYDYITRLSPDIIIPMSIQSALEIAFERKYDIPIVASVHLRPDLDYTNILWYRPEFLLENYKNSYKDLSGCHILLDSFKKFLPNTFNSEIFSIPNPVPQVGMEDIVVHTNDKDRLVITNVARLDNVTKQQSVAIEVFSRLAKKYPKWDLHFWGTGNDEPILREKIIGLGLEDRIFLKGFTDNPIEKLKKSDIFLFPSKSEGFGLALSSIGLPSIGFESCSGVNELIEHNKNGFLAKDNIEMQNYLEVLMKDPEIRNKLGKQANKDMQKYDPEIIANKWHELINNF